MRFWVFIYMMAKPRADSRGKNTKGHSSCQSCRVSIRGGRAVVCALSTCVPGRWISAVMSRLASSSETRRGATSQPALDDAEIVRLRLQLPRGSHTCAFGWYCADVALCLSPARRHSDSHILVLMGKRLNASFCQTWGLNVSVLSTEEVQYMTFITVRSQTGTIRWDYHYQTKSILRESILLSCFNVGGHEDEGYRDSLLETAQEAGTIATTRVYKYTRLIWQKRFYLSVCIWFQEWEHLGPE